MRRLYGRVRDPRCRTADIRGRPHTLSSSDHIVSVAAIGGQPDTGSADRGRGHSRPDGFLGERDGVRGRIVGAEYGAGGVQAVDN